MKTAKLTQFITTFVTTLVTTLATLFVLPPSAYADPSPQSSGPRSSGAQTQTAIFAGGCFWCMEADFEKLPGVSEVVSGYTGGYVLNPTYKQVSRTSTGHYEAVEVFYDPSKVSYDELLTHFWHNVDPTDAGGQFCDRGDSYRTAIFASPEQMPAAVASREAVTQSKPFAEPIVTPVLGVQTFYPAEDYHQDYYKKNKGRYNYYRRGCGRDRRLTELWGKSH